MVSVWSVFYLCVLNGIPEKLKFTPTPQPAQCLELDKEITIQCSAKGREAPTIRWTKAGALRSLLFFGVALVTPATGRFHLHFDMGEDGE